MNEWVFHCKILGVSPHATQKEIKEAYTAQAKLFHPDKHQDSSVAKNKFQQLQESYGFLKKNHRFESKKSNFAQPKQKRKTSKTKSMQWMWIYASVFLLMIGLTVWMFQPKKAIEQPAANLSSQEIEQVLAQYRLYTFETHSKRKDCKILSRDDPDFNQIVAARERFPNSNCGDVRAYIRHTGADITIVSPTLESCRCQINELKKKPKIDTSKSSFSNQDL